MSKDWLSTRQAAKRLGVSEASVRRWSDRGLLPVQRVGKRLERRFKAEHLERFAVSTSPGRVVAADRLGKPGLARTDAAVFKPAQGIETSQIIPLVKRNVA